MTCRRLPVALLVPALLAGCTTAAETGYPSLAIRDVERVTGSLEPAAPTLAPAPVVAPPATLASVDALVAQANTAHGRFERAADAARRAVAAASGTQAGSESWAQAQVALAALEASRSRAMVALADLDRIYVDAALEGPVPVSVEEAHGAVSGLVREESALIGSLASALR